jgi:hypothetical protein
VEVEHDRPGNDDRRERVVEHAVNLRGDDAAGHELVECSHWYSLLVVSRWTLRRQAKPDVRRCTTAVSHG